MPSLAKLMLSSILITLIILGLNSPVAAQPSAPTIYVDAPSTVTVSTEFDIIIWIRDIPNGWRMIGFAIAVSFDPDDVEFIDADFLDPDGAGGWNGDGILLDPGEWRGGASGPDWTEDKTWFLLTFHCLRAGPTEITVSSPITPMNVVVSELLSSIELTDGEVIALTEPDPVSITVWQESGAVGGITIPTNKLEILTPYIALAGLLAAVSAVIIKKRK